MTFDAREATAAAEAAYPPFRFVGMDGRDYTLPHPMLVPIEMAKRVQAGEITGDQLIADLAPEAAAAIDRMGPAVQSELIAAWQAEMGGQLEELGKEPELPSQTPTSAPPSKRSSRPGARTSGSSQPGE